MSKTIIPANYTPALNLYDTQRAIGTEIGRAHV